MHPGLHDIPPDEALVRLMCVGGATRPRRQLLDAWASPDAALAAGRDAWHAAGMDHAQADSLAALRPISPRIRDWLARPGHRIIGWHDPDYPALLRRIPSPPLALFVAGDANLLWHPSVAVVGSRLPSAGGRDNARDFAAALSDAGFAVCSGLASGIDAAAHEATLATGGATIAVLGSGVDIPYPRAHADLHARIAGHGVVVSEHPPGASARREHFPSRNRIIAGLSLGTLVIEAAERSGALITARMAAESGREVFAIPGSIHNPMSRGCHRLISEGAGLVQTAGDVLATLGPVAHALGDALRGRLHAPIQETGNRRRDADIVTAGNDPDYQRLWSALGHDPSPMDSLVVRTGLTAAELSSMLLVMELEGRVACEHGRYSRLS